MSWSCSGQEVEAAEEEGDLAAKNQPGAQEEDCKAEAEGAGGEQQEAEDEGHTCGKEEEAEPMPNEEEKETGMEMDKEAAEDVVEGGIDGGVSMEEGAGSVRPARREGWKAVGATVRVQKGLGYLAGSAQPPGWEEKEKGASRGSPKGMQKYLDEMSSLASRGAERDPPGEGGEEEEGGPEGVVPSAKKGGEEETPKNEGSFEVKAAAEEAEPMSSVRKEGGAAEVEMRPASAKVGGGRLKKVGEAACVTPVVENGGANGAVPLEEEDEERGAPVQASSKKGRKRGKRILLESDESSQEGAADVMTNEPTRPEAPKGEPEEEKEDGKKEPEQVPVKRQPADEAASQGSGDEVIACLGKGNKRKKAGQGTAPKAAANKRKKKGSEALAAGVEFERGPRAEGEGTKEGSANGVEAATGETLERKREEQHRAVSEQAQKAAGAADEQDAPICERDGQPAEPRQDEDMETEAAGEPKSAAQRSPLVAAAAGLGRTPGKNALVRAKPKPIVRRVGGKPNRAFRPPARVKAAETESGQERPAKKPKGGAKKGIAAEAEKVELAGEDQKEDGQQGDLQPPEEASQEEQGQAGKRKSGQAEEDKQGEEASGKDSEADAKKGNSGKKKRKLASNGSVAVGRRSEEMVTPAKGREQKAGPVEDKPDFAAEPMSDEPLDEATGGASKPEEVPPLKTSKKGAGVVEKKSEGGGGKTDGKENKKGGKKSPGVKKKAGKVKGEEVAKTAKEVSLSEANKENIKSEAETAAAQGASCERGSGPGAAQTAPYFAFGGSGEQKDSMVKKVKVRPTLDPLYLSIGLRPLHFAPVPTLGQGGDSVSDE